MRIFHDTFQFLKEEKKYGLLLLILLLTYLAVSSWQRYAPSETVNSPALQELREAETRISEQVQDMGALREFLKKRPDIARLLQAIVFFASGLFSLGLVILLAAFFNPSWRQKWKLSADPPDTADWRLSLLFKVILHFVTASFALTLLLAFLRRFVFPNADINLLLLLQTTLVDVLCLYFMIDAVRRSGGGWKDLGFRIPKKGWVGEMIMGIFTYVGVFPLFIAVMVFLVFLAHLFSYEPPAHPLVNILLEEEERSPVILGYSVFLATVIAPFLEEVFFRGFCYPIFKKRWGMGAGMVLSSLFFACIHNNTFAFWPIFVLGMALSYIYEKRSSLVAPVILHLFHNSIFIFYFFLAKQALASI